MWIDLLTAVLKLIGLVSWADKIITAREAKHQAQEVANVPQTKQEESDYFK